MVAPPLAAALLQVGPQLEAALLQVAVQVQVEAAHQPVALRLQLPHQVSQVTALVAYLWQQNLKHTNASCVCAFLGSSLYIQANFKTLWV